ncbi:MAG: hypothetical protein LUG98_11875 [Tannerellaceae bacterium]|nr:hypothetical protein [Tannerellaceae bacterium]
MPVLAAISTVDFPYKTSQQTIKEFAKDMFSGTLPEVDRILSVFDHTEIETRNFCKPPEYYFTIHSFEERNREYIRISLDYSVKAIEKCLAAARVEKKDVTDILFVSTTGLATPSMDALIVNEMRLNPYINRTPVFGLGCGGGVSGFARACTLAKANPDAVVLLVAVELCSLTFMRKDFSKSNFIGTSLFSDGIAACLITGDKRIDRDTVTPMIRFAGNKSHLYYDSAGVMGWDFTDEGFKVLFSSGIPEIISKHVKKDVTSFLAKSGLDISGIRQFIFHPGGKKVLAAYENALGAKDDFLRTTRGVMKDYGNMSSASVLYVLERFFSQGFEDGYGLMASMGPGFSCEMVLLEMENK